MQFPCELVVWKILPAIKAQLARNLKDTTDMKQKDIAKVLDSTEAAISQYLSGKRASEFKIPEEVKDMLNVVTSAIGQGKNQKVLQFGICQICREIRTKGMACDACKSESGNAENCHLCMK
ncbi:hypothetical protein HOD83_02680 [Candidatus Woesearchaeota archaeon]|jgi:uncharacterized protein|nr:hypothetical protein [Candidatus Woesearchaeota archaeon]MBT4114592.1 hypothetical protein [Candidatus Woesearchaeota archaeon]MBT4248473.1 hypothetical protein [Candidatus Woesearchaeota archaeon]